MFCERIADKSTEHVLPDWLNEVFGGEPHKLAIQTAVERPGQVYREWENSPFELTTGLICQSCNGGWMSTMEKDARPLLEPMLHGRPRQLSPADQRLLATWAVKTLMTFEYTLPDAHRVAIKREDYRALYEACEASRTHKDLILRRPPALTAVAVAATRPAQRGENPSWIRVSPIRVRHPGVAYTPLVGRADEINAYTGLIRLGALVLVVLRSAAPDLPVSLRLSHSVMRRAYGIWPICTPVVNWPPFGPLSTGMKLPNSPGRCDHSTAADSGGCLPCSVIVPTLKTYV